LIPAAILIKILRSKKLQTEETSRNKHDFKGGLAREADYLTHSTVFTTWIRIISGKLIIAQLATTFPTFCGRFLAILITGRLNTVLR
jgi:hypothetical protein